MKSIHSGLLATTWLMIFGSFSYAAALSGDQTSNKPPVYLSKSSPENQPVAERLIANIPEGWHNILQIDGINTRYSDFVPADQSGSDWESRLSFEAIVTEHVSVDPIDMLNSVALEDAPLCSFIENYNIFSGYENGYPTSVRLFLCGMKKSTGSGEIKLIKIIRGKRHVHSIRLMKRIPAFEQGEQDFTAGQIADWSIFLNHSRLCDDTKNHPCPTSPESGD